MKKVAIIYFSKTNTTTKLAEAIAFGLQTHDIEVVNIRILGKDIIEGRYVNQDVLDQLNECHAIAFGTPTYMGNASAQFKAFMDSTSEIWSNQSWAGKLASGFTCGSGLNGDQSNTLMSMVTFANQHGMLWIGLDVHYINSKLNRLGCQTGIVATPNDPENGQGGDVNEQDLLTAEYLGNRIAQYVTRL